MLQMLNPKQTPNILCVVAISCLSGCLGAAPDPPLTTSRLEAIARNAIFYASIEKTDTHSFVSMQDDPLKTASKLLVTMTPITRFDKCPKENQKSEYVFKIQYGADPVVFYIDVRSKNLLYQCGGYIYEGGNSVEFVRILKPLLK